MRLTKRVQKLERSIGLTGPCRICGGQARGRIAFAVKGSDLVPLYPTGCRGCGAERVWKRIVIDGVDEPGVQLLCAISRARRQW